MAGVEIERKFLVDGVPPELERHPATTIEQGYLAVADDGVEVRIRRRAGEATLTVKSGPGQVRVEEELAIDAERFDALWPLTEHRRIAKTRHLVPLGEHTAEVDVYTGPLDGLVVAEVEFGSAAAASAFVPPAWLGTEVTGDPRYANQALARLSRPPG